MSYQDTFKAENYDFQSGVSKTNTIENSVLRFNYSNVKINLADSLLAKRSKTFIKLVFEQLKNKDQFDKIQV